MCLPVVSNDDDGVFTVECDVSQFGFLLACDELFTHVLILVDAEIIYVDLKHVILFFSLF